MLCKIPKHNGLDNCPMVGTIVPPVIHVMTEGSKPEEKKESGKVEWQRRLLESPRLVLGGLKCLQV
jgi:hypothetical protein